MKTKLLKKDQTYQQLLKMAFDDNYLSGKTFPPERELCGKLGVSRVTLRAALDRLARDGIITRSHYYGTRVNMEKTAKKLLVTGGDFKNGWVCVRIAESLEKRCCELNIATEKFSIDFINDSRVLRNKFSGIIFIGCNFIGNEPFLKVIEESEVPTVCVGTSANDDKVLKLPSVRVDYYGAWNEGLRHLISHGANRIASLLKDEDHNLKRLGFTGEEYRKLLHDKEVPDSIPLTRTDCREGKLHAVVSELLKLPKPPEAIFCYSDVFAIEVCEILRSLGVKIPDEIMVLGMGALPGADQVKPVLASVDLNYDLLGYTALELLLRHSSWRGTCPRLLLPYSLFPGETTRRYIIKI